MIPRSVGSRNWRRIAPYTAVSSSAFSSFRQPSRWPRSSLFPRVARRFENRSLQGGAPLHPWQQIMEVPSSATLIDAQRLYATSSSSNSSLFFNSRKERGDGTDTVRNNKSEDAASNGNGAVPEASRDDVYVALNELISEASAEAVEVVSTEGTGEVSANTSTDVAQSQGTTPAAASSSGKDNSNSATSQRKDKDKMIAAAAAVSEYHSPWDDKGAGLVRRRVAQWYVPGLEREHRHLSTETPAAPSAVAEAVNAALRGNGTKDAREETEKSPLAAAAAVLVADAPPDRTSKSRTTAGRKTKREMWTATPDAVNGANAETAAAIGAATTAAETADKTTRAVGVTLQEAASPHSLSSSSTAAAVTVKANTATVSATSVKSEAKSTSETTADTKGEEQSGASQKTRATTAADGKSKQLAAKEKGEEGDDDDVDDELPNTLLAVQKDRNKRIKRLLMASLGSDFAKAGLSNDGVRTSFSVVNYQTIKQLTGLARIPSTLLISCMVAPANQFSWIDISMHPIATLSEYKAALEEVLLGLGMHRSVVEESAEPMLLPQVTVAKGCYSILMRYAIEAPANKQMNSFQDLTNRFTVLMTQSKIITVHRTQCSYVEELKLNWQHYLAGEGLDQTPKTYCDISRPFPVEKEESALPHGVQYLLYYFVKEAVGTFSQAIAKCIVEFDRYEANLFNSQKSRSSMAREIYHIKRRASVYGRTLRLTQDAYSHIATALHISSAQVGYQEIMHDLAHVESLAEELNANADSVLQLLFQLSSYQVNELMRVLTLFSAFFIPLSFIASVYGMNFEDLPMLHNDYGGVFCAMLMCTVATCIFLWFRSNRFI